MKRIETKKIMTKYDKISLRVIAQQLDLNYSALLKKRYMPIPGEVYDPETINYDALDAYINERVAAKYDEDPDYAIQYDQLNWEELNEESGRKGAGVSAAKNFSDDAYAVGQQLTLRNSQEAYKVVYRNEGYICLEGLVSGKLKTMNANTFLHQTPRSIIEEG